MAIPFKSPIRIGSICASDGDATKLTLNVYDMNLQSSDSSIQINGASGNNFINLTSSNININTTNSGNLRITSSNINITDNDRIILQHGNNHNQFGDSTIPTYLEGYPFYISGLGIENDVLIFNENGITLSNNTKNTNIKGSNIVIDGSRLTVPADTKLNSTSRTLDPTSIACINDLGFQIIPTKNSIWPEYSPLIYIIPKSDAVDFDISDETITIKLNSITNSGVIALQTFENISFMFAWRLKTEDYQTVYCLYMKNNAWNIFYRNFTAHNDLSWTTDNAQFYLISQKNIGINPGYTVTVYNGKEPDRTVSVVVNGQTIAPGTNYTFKNIKELVFNESNVGNDITVKMDATSTTWGVGDYTWTDGFPRTIIIDHDGNVAVWAEVF